MALKLLCSHCGNPAPAREARICTTCGAHFLQKARQPCQPANTEAHRPLDQFAYVGAAVGIAGALAIWIGLHHVVKAPAPVVWVKLQPGVVSRP